MLLQILLQTVCWSVGLSDTRSVSTTRLTTAEHAHATTGQFAVSVNLVPLLRAPTPSHRTAAGAAKAACTRAESEPMERRGMIPQTLVPSVFVTKVLCSVRGNPVHHPTATTQ